MKATLYTCDDCGTQDTFSSYLKARAASWAISKDYKRCYCPECAPAHRLGGANGKTKPAHKWQPPQGYEQLKLDV